MIIYRDGRKTRGRLWDSEGHVIRYAVNAADGKVVFVSDPGPGWRFSLTLPRADSCGDPVRDLSSG